MARSWPPQETNPADSQVSSAGTATGRGNSPQRLWEAGREGLARLGNNNIQPAFRPHASLHPNCCKSLTSQSEASHSVRVLGSTQRISSTKAVSNGCPKNSDKNELANASSGSPSASNEGPSSTAGKEGTVLASSQGPGPPALAAVLGPPSG